MNEEDFYAEILNRIEKVSDTLGITEKEIANRLDIPRSTYFVFKKMLKGESNRKVLSDEKIVNVANKLGIEVISKHYIVKLKENSLLK